MRRAMVFGFVLFYSPRPSSQFVKSYKANFSAATTAQTMAQNTLDWEEGKDAFRSIIPPLTFDSHKGQMGRIGVLGGSKDFTGAPFYAASAALKVGADLVYVFTAEEAALPLKCYSPELMVTPVYSHARLAETAPQPMIDAVSAFLPRLHALVVGPGLGREPAVLEAVEGVLQRAQGAGVPVVLDADALFLVAGRPGAVRGGGAGVILTPNIMEFRKIWGAVFGAEVPLGNAGELARELGVTIVLKGKHDVIASPDGSELVCTEQGGRKRGGGQGDLLSGAAGPLAFWAGQAAAAAAAEGEGEQQRPPALATALWGGCVLVKRASRMAFEKKKRSMTAPDVLAEIGECFDEMAPVDV